MPRPRKKQPDLGAMADEVNDILHHLSAQGYGTEVGRIRTFLQAQGEHFANSARFNRNLNNELTKKLLRAEGILAKQGISLDT